MMATRIEDSETSPAVRLKRRQSDARWRANVATCFETLKHVIPMNRRATKRQISKAIILQETSQHITFLDEILQNLLREKGQVVGESCLDEYCENQLQEIKQGFIDKQPYRESFSKVKKDDVIFSHESGSCYQMVPFENEHTNTLHIPSSPGEKVKKTRKIKRGRKPIISSVIDEVVDDGSVKTKKVRDIDPYNEGYEVVDYGCAPILMKKALSKTRKLTRDVHEVLGGSSDVSSIESMHDRVIVKRRVSKDEQEASTGLVLNMQYSRLRVNKGKVKRRKGPRKNIGGSVSSSQIVAAKANNTKTLSTNRDKCHYANSEISILDKACTSQAQQRSSDLQTTSENGQLDGIEVPGVSSCSLQSDTEGTCEQFAAKDYMTPVKRQTGGSTGFTPVRLPCAASHLLENWKEREDNIDCAASLICDEDLPVSDEEEDFIESNRSRQGRLKRDIFNHTLIPKRKRHDSERTVCSDIDGISSKEADIKCRRFIDWDNKIHENDADDSAVDEAMSLLFHNSTSPIATESVDGSTLSDDLKDLDIIPFDLNTDPVRELDKYITAQDRVWQEPADFSNTTSVFDQIFSGDYYHEKFENHIAHMQLDGLQRELRQLEEDPSGSIPVGKISGGCDIDL